MLKLINYPALLGVTLSLSACGLGHSYAPPPEDGYIKPEVSSQQRKADYAKCSFNRPLNGVGISESISWNNFAATDFCMVDKGYRPQGRQANYGCNVYKSIIGKAAPACAARGIY